MSRSQLPLNALRAFEAAARHASFTHAAEELHVTQAAVSHQVKALEERLGVALFVRRPRGLEITSEGEALLPDLRDAFDRMTTQVAGAGASAGSTLDSTRDDLQQFTAGTLPEVRDLVSELREVTATLRRVSSEVERNPSVLLYGKPPSKRGPGE